MPWYWREERPLGTVRCKGDEAPSEKKAEGGRKAILDLFWMDEDVTLDEAFGVKVPWHDGFTSGGE